MNIEQRILRLRSGQVSNFEGMHNYLICQFTNSLSHAVLAKSAVNAKETLIRGKNNDNSYYFYAKQSQFQKSRN